MKRKTFSILFALVLVLSFSLIPAVPAMANDVPSSTMIFEGTLTPNGDGTYSGVIPMTEGEYYVPDGGGAGISEDGGFDVYAKEGGTAYVQGMIPDSWTIGSDHDAYSQTGPWGTWYDPDCADWFQYSLDLTATHWYLRYTPTGESPMSGVMYWYGDGTGYAAETDPGTVRNDDGSNPTDPLNRDATRYANGSAQEWGWHCGWGEERIPLEFPGFEVVVTPGSYAVTMTPAPGPVTNVTKGTTYGTIQLAVDDASNGDIISVAAGTYAPFTVDGKTGLTIQSNSVVTVQGVQSVPTAYTNRDCVVFIKNSSNVVLDGLDIEGNGLGTTNTKSYGVIYEDSSGKIQDCTVSPNTIGDMSGIAIGIWDGSNPVTIEGCEIKNFGRIGIFIYNGCIVDVLDSTIIGQVYSGEGQVCYGIEVEGAWNSSNPATASQVMIRGNEIYDCDNTYDPDPSWGSAGILVNGWLEYFAAADSTVIIEGNNIHDNFDGVIAIKSPSSRANFNEIYDNRQHGVVSAAAFDDSTAVFDALYNWWGDASGPLDEIKEGDDLNQYNPGGLGDPVSEWVLYDPWIGQGGMVTGGGWIYSTAGAYSADPELEGKATFGFVSKYKKGAAVPTGNTQFNFQVADLNFHSDSYDWLVIAGTKAMFKGIGTINGAGNYGFMLSAIDGNPDKFRIKIQDKATDTVIYDNGSDQDIGGGNIVVHKK